jgi:predicted ArsR family transcriptional regulator
MQVCIQVCIHSMYCTRNKLYYTRNGYAGEFTVSSTNNVQEIIVLEINCIILEMDTQESLQCQVQIIPSSLI